MTEYRIITIGGNDRNGEALSPDSWQNFRADVRSLCERHGEIVGEQAGYGQWEGSEPEASYSVHILIDPTLADYDRLRLELAYLGEHYTQDAIGWSRGEIIQSAQSPQD